MQHLTLFVLLLIQKCSGRIDLEYPLAQFDWIVGKWRSDFGGKLDWPTVPTMTYGEELEIWPAPVSSAAEGARFLNFSSRAWAVGFGDHFHDEYGFLSADPQGGAIFYQNGNNGFTTVEEGVVSPGLLQLRLRKIARVQVAREIPVLDLQRQFRLVGDNMLEQILMMRTSQHPADAGTVLEHARIYYSKIL